MERITACRVPWRFRDADDVGDFFGRIEVSDGSDTDIEFVNGDHCEFAVTVSQILIGASPNDDMV